MNLQLSKSLSADDLREIIFRWNIDFPVDRWWRKTHNVAFNSERHREVSFIDMYIEWEEESMYIDSENQTKDTYIPNTGSYYKGKTVVDEEISEENFSKINMEEI